MSDQRHPTPVGSLKIMALELAEALIQAEISNVDPTDSLRIVERRHWLIEAALHKAYSLAPRSETVARQDIPEGRGSLPAGALERGSPLDAARGVNPGGAAPGGVSERCDDKVGGALCEHKNQMWNIQFTHGHCKDCGAEFGLVQSAVGATDAKHEELARTLRQALFVTKAGFPAVPLNMALDALADLASTISPQSATAPMIQGPLPDDVDWSKMRPGPITFVPSDEPRVDWLQSHNASIYRSLGGDHWVVVDETAKVRKGNLGKTLREAIDDAMSATKSGSAK